MIVSRARRIAALSALLAFTAPAMAQNNKDPIADFYRGKTVTICNVSSPAIPPWWRPICPAPAR